jgi:LDH2 family malate/lactate/ureidoglycolate dehydrogenase
MRIDAFRPAEEFKKHMDQWINRFRNATPVHTNQPVLIPGDPERAFETIRMQQGIPLVEAVVEDLNQLAYRWGIEI